MPDAGDVVICRNDSGAARFLVGVYGQPPQMTYGTYDLAVHEACAFARTVEVDVWFTEGDHGFVEVARYRPDQQRRVSR